MDRCLSCMSAITEDKICRHCGFDNNDIEPNKMRQLMPGIILRDRFLFGLSVKSNNIFTTYIAYDLDKKRRIYIDEFLPSNITKRALGKLKVVVRDEYNAKYERAKSLVIRQTKYILGLKSKSFDIIGAFAANNTFYIIREYTADTLLSDYIKKNKNITVEYAQHIAVSLIKIMEPLHNNDIICGNIKPENIVIDAIDSVKIINFGFGSLSGILPVPVSEGYSPVEQYKRGEKLTPRADVYSIAAVCYAVAADERPVSAKKRHKTDTLMPLSTMGISINRSTENALLNALNILPKNRTASLKDFYDELKNRDTVRRWERVKEAPKKDYSFFTKKVFWLRLLISAVIIVMVVSLVGIIYETAAVKSRVKDKELKESEISTMAVPHSETTTKISNKNN